MEEKLYKNTEGLPVIIDMGEDVSTATNIVLHVTKPDSTTTTWTGAIVYNTNYFKYTLKSGDVDQVGPYKIHPHSTLGSWTGFWETTSIRVYDEYE